MKRVISTLLCLCLCTAVALAIRNESFINVIEGTASNMPPRYVMPLLSNGNLSIRFDTRGTQMVAPTYTADNGILWQGRRVGPPRDALFSFGHLKEEIACGGRDCGVPEKWSQTLDTRHAELRCENAFGGGLTVRTEIFVHAERNIVAIRKTFNTTQRLSGPVAYRLYYDLSAQKDSFVTPHRMTFAPLPTAGTQSVDIAYTAIGHRDYAGILTFCSDRPAQVDGHLRHLSLAIEVEPQPNHPESVCFFLLFSDNLETDDAAVQIAQYKQLTAVEGYEGLRASHRTAWDDYWSRLQLNIPDERLERAYVGGLYQLKSNATKWSFPVGIGPWSGHFFAFDETYCYMGLASSNHLDIARRAPEFRRKYLQWACERTNGTGARYPWETIEDGFEATPYPYRHWFDHVFHMSHIATAAWTHYLYTNDRAFLKDVAFPMMKECARFFLLQMCYWHPDGSVTLGKTTDLERLGAAVENPFFSSCGAIYTMESTLKAAAILGEKDEIFARFQTASEGLRKTLPNDGQKYMPYAGCSENSIAVTTGMYPYPVLSTDDPLERAAVMHFYDERYKAGNMYAIGSGLCPWYASWMASVLANYGDRDKSLSLLHEAAAQIGYFSEHFEINEKDVVRVPWFTTAAGNYVHALDQTMLLNRGDDVFVCHATPTEWKDYSFTLPCYGNMLLSVEFRKGKLRKCEIAMNRWSDSCSAKTFWIPDHLLELKQVSKAVLPQMEHSGNYYKFHLKSLSKTINVIK
ncbi:MAG: hypothetical protein IJL45_02940 [Prevotella sp.]|nr:hypothetical protein [Prevotella sp.]